MSSKEFWDTQTSSLHRSNDSSWYQKKAEEHVALMTYQEKTNGIIDLGCGAGELLKPLSHSVKINAGVDFSTTMLDEAKRLNSNSHIDFLEDDVFTLLPIRDDATWTTTGALNQYLDSQQLDKLFQIFSSNSYAQSFLLFDTVDPIRYKLLSTGISYIHKTQKSENQLNKRFYIYARDVYIKIKLIRLVTSVFFSNSESIKLGSSAMGYGYLPKFWHNIAQRYKLELEIVSSRYYEYRYHLLFRKR